MTSASLSVPIERLGRSGLAVSRLCLGTMMFGGRAPESEAMAIVAEARDRGVNFIDTADVYNEGESERIVGRAVRPERDRWILATKAGNAMGEGPNRRGLSRRWLLAACEASLSRLGTDFIDIYYLHREDHATPLEETVAAIGRLLADGKIRYWGVSNFRAWRLAELCRIADGLGIPRPVASQPYYNAFNRQPEVEHLPACRHYGLGAVPYSPLARGVLTGKYPPGEAPSPESRAGAADRRIMQTEWRPESLEKAQAVRAHAERRGLTAGQFALAWVLNNAAVTAVIAGPRTLAQWQDYFGGLDYRIDDADEALVDSLAAPGHPSSPGYNDPAYPIEGRTVRHRPAG